VPFNPGLDCIKKGDPFWLKVNKTEVITNKGKRQTNNKNEMKKSKILFAIIFLI